MPESLRPGLSSAMLKSVFDDIEEAISSGTLDEVDDRHLSRTPMVVDKQGWEETATLLSDTLDRCWRSRPRPPNGSPTATSRAC